MKILFIIFIVLIALIIFGIVKIAIAIIRYNRFKHQKKYVNNRKNISHQKINNESKPANQNTNVDTKVSHNNIVNESETSDPIVLKGNVSSEKFDVTEENISKIKEKFIAFDVETTGFYAYSGDRIVEISAVVFENGIETDSFSSLVNPKITIPEEASRINQITNEMIQNAPSEAEVYNKFINFIGDAINGNIYLCAHNADFDIGFLSNTLIRLGIDADLKYIDTLSLAQKYIKKTDVENHKLVTVGEYFGLDNPQAHRAMADAEMCGNILLKLIGYVENRISEEKKIIECSMPSDDELEVCAVIQEILKSKKLDISLLRFSKNDRYVNCTFMGTFLSFKFSKSGKYIILPSEMLCENHLSQECTYSEGGKDYKRIFFNSPFEIGEFSECIVKMYLENYTLYKTYIKKGKWAKEEVENSARTKKKISDDELKTILLSISKKEYTNTTDYESINNKKEEIKLTINDVTINADNSRCTLNEILNYDDPDNGYRQGYSQYEKGEELRKNGKLEDAISLFDEARFNGYDAPALYMSYAKAYRKLKDYENEISIIEEYFSRSGRYNDEYFEHRLESAIKLLYQRQHSKK